jgi:hypothetical protein
MEKKKISYTEYLRGDLESYPGLVLTLDCFGWGLADGIGYWIRRPSFKYVKAGSPRN